MSDMPRKLDDGSMLMATPVPGHHVIVEHPKTKKQAVVRFGLQRLTLANGVVIRWPAFFEVVDGVGFDTPKSEGAALSARQTAQQAVAEAETLRAENARLRDRVFELTKLEAAARHRVEAVRLEATYLDADGEALR